MNPRIVVITGPEVTEGIQSALDAAQKVELESMTLSVESDLAGLFRKPSQLGDVALVFAPGEQITDTISKIASSTSTIIIAIEKHEDDSEPLMITTTWENLADQINETASWLQSVLEATGEDGWKKLWNVIRSMRDNLPFVHTDSHAFLMILATFLCIEEPECLELDPEESSEPEPESP